MPKPLELLSGDQPGRPTGVFIYPAANRPFERGNNRTGVALERRLRLNSKNVVILDTQVAGN